MAEDDTEATSARLRPLTRLAEVVAQAATAVAAEVSLPRMAAVVLEQTTKLLEARVAHLYLADESARRLTLLDHRGMPDDLVERVRSVPFEAPLLAARAAVTRRTQVVEGAHARDPALATAHEILARTGCTAMIAVPLTALGRLAGVLTYGVAGAHRFSPEEHRTMVALAELFAVGLSNARTYEREGRLRRQLEAVSAAALAISGEFDLARILQTIVEEARRIAGAEMAALGIVASTGVFEPWVFCGVRDELMASIGRSPRAVGLLGAVPAEDRIIRLRDVAADPRHRGLPAHHPAIRNFLGVPIRHRGKSAGNLYLANKVGGEEFSEEDEAAMERLAAHAGAALEHARLRDAVEAERARLDTILQSAPHGILYLDAENGRLVANPGAEQIMGLHVDPAAGVAQLVGRVLHVDGRPLTLDELGGRRALRGQSVPLEEVLFLRPGGARRHLLVSAAPVRAADGPVTGAVVVFLDVTERRRMEQALRDSEERFRLLAENARDLITRYRLTPPRGFEYVSPSAAAITGYAPEEWYADPNLAFAIIHPDDRPILEAAAEHPEAFLRQPLVLRWRRKDGARLWMEHRVAAVRDEAGNIVSIDGIARDVTERKRSEEERERLLDNLTAERSWLRAVIDNSPVGVLLVEDADGTQLTVNRAFEEIAGKPLSPEEGLGAFVAQIVHPDGTPVAFGDLARVRALRGERVCGVEMHIVRTDGRAIPVLVSAGPIRDAAGEITGAVVVFEDITVLKNLERLRDEWTSIIAHDLRQPVSVITGYGGVLAGQIGDEDAPSKRALTHILAAARQLDRMINDLLDVSRIDTRRLTLERQPTDLSALVRTVVERAAEITKEHQVQVSIAGEVPEIAVDPGRIEQIVDNLLSNAAKYGSPGASIRVEVARRVGEVELAVVNRGRGIAPEDVPCLFTRFHRTGMAKEDKVPGVGLGLYITKGLVEAHGGRIWVESVPGETTAFRFVLPLAA